MGTSISSATSLDSLRLRGSALASPVAEAARQETARRDGDFLRALDTMYALAPNGHAVFGPSSESLVPRMRRLAAAERDPRMGAALLAVANTSAAKRDPLTDTGQAHRDARAGARELAPALLDHVRDFWAGHGVPRSARPNAPVTLRHDDPSGTAWSSPSARTIAFGRFASGAPTGLSADVLAHEYAHIVMGSFAAPRKTVEATAVQESLADTMALSMRPERKDWIVGADVGEHVRDMLAPAEGQPRHIRDLLLAPENEHDNAAIGNLAAATIGEAIGREKLSAIYAHAIRTNMAAMGSYRGLADTVTASAAILHGENSREIAVVRSAFSLVGLPPRPKPVR